MLGAQRTLPGGGERERGPLGRAASASRASLRLSTSVVMVTASTGSSAIGSKVGSELRARVSGLPRASTGKDRGAIAMGDHLIVLHSAVRACAGYSRHDAPSILMDGTSMERDTEHGRAITAQLTRRHGTLEEAIEAGAFALGAAGLSKGIRRQARAACEDYFYNRLSLTPSDELGGPEEIVEGLELMPDPMYRALEDIVELVVDGDYEELRAVSRDRLAVEDMRRRVEDDCPESLVLPPREIFRVEAITKSDEPDVPGWAYFLELWTETGPARLHIEGELEESGERFTATLDDILP